VGLRRTIIVHTRLAGHMARVQAARAGESGVQILTIGQLVARDWPAGCCGRLILMI
jgi:hypothetical protein